MKKIFILSFFQRSIKKMDKEQRTQISESLEVFNDFILYNNLPVGFRFKKINHDKYEFRAELKLRIVVKIENENIFLILAGNHDQIKKSLKEFKNS